MRSVPADLDKPGVYRCGRAFSNSWGLFRRKPSRVGRAVPILLYDGGLALKAAGFLFSTCFYIQHTRSSTSMRPPCPVYFFSCKLRLFFSSLGTDACSSRGACCLLSACLSVRSSARLIVCVSAAYITIAKAVRHRFPRTQRLQKRASLG